MMKRRELSALHYVLAFISSAMKAQPSRALSQLLTTALLASLKSQLSMLGYIFIQELYLQLARRQERMAGMTHIWLASAYTPPPAGRRQARRHNVLSMRMGAPATTLGHGPSSIL